MRVSCPSTGRELVIIVWWNMIKEVPPARAHGDFAMCDMSKMPAIAHGGCSSVMLVYCTGSFPSAEFDQLAAELLVRANKGVRF